ncbi:hypothetical protein FACS1894133_1900 [Clostridia bacterium]|nr:hypothetical protein FACS1894133_1900 [Clostridia bacterium]
MREEWFNVKYSYEDKEKVSTDAKKVNNTSRKTIYGPVERAVAVTSFVAVLAALVRPLLPENEVLIVVCYVLVIIIAALLISVYIGNISQRKSDNEKEEVAEYSKELKEAIAPNEQITINIDSIRGDICYRNDTVEKDDNDNKSAGVDALGLMRINLEEIKGFYTWNKKQAKDSFSLAVGACIFGFALLVAAIVLPVALGLNGGTAVIPVIGGVIVELIAGTALIVYKNSLSQLNHYYKALHENERFLSSVNLIGKFSKTEMQDEMLREIISSEVQMNLMSIGIKGDEKKPGKGQKKPEATADK